MKLADKRLAERKLIGGGWKEEAERRTLKGGWLQLTTATTTTTTSCSLALSQLCAADFVLAETKEMTET